MGAYCSAAAMATAAYGLAAVDERLREMAQWPRATNAALWGRWPSPAAKAGRCSAGDGCEEALIMSNPLLVLAEHAAGWRGRPIPRELEHHARRALVDWFAALLAGASMAPASLLAPALAEGPPRGRGAICYVDGARGSVRRAALLNATASHAPEFDDIHRDSGYHPGCPTIPAALAAAQDRGADMATLLRAVIAGYEVGCRIGVAVQPTS